MTESNTATAGRGFVLYPSLWRRLAAMVYESLLVAAILIVAGFLFGAAFRKVEGWDQWIFRLYLVLILGCYFVWCWRRGGRTLAMKAWRLRVSNIHGGPIGIGRALFRFGLALLTFGTAVVGLMLLREHAQTWTTWLLLLPACLSVLWALFDRDRQFLHDRLAGTRLVLVKSGNQKLQG